MENKQGKGYKYDLFAMYRFVPGIERERHERAI